MFSTICAVNQLAAQVGIPIDMRCKTNFKVIVDLIRANDGFIYGSIVHKYLSKLDYHVRDLDVLFLSKGHLMQFRNAITRLDNRPVRHTQIWEEYYTFSSAICKESWSHTVEIGNGSRMTIQAGLLDVKQISDQWVKYRKNTSPTCEDVARCLAEMQFTDDFLCNFWMGDYIYHKLRDVVNVEIANHLMHNDTNHKRYVKYSYRGVKLILKDMSDQIAPSLTYMIHCKDSYRALGLVVIPVGRKDNELAGKTPMVSKWPTKNKSFDFKIYNPCTNIGLVCGPNSGIVCIDVDRKDNGVKMFNRLVERYGLPTNCPVQSTGNNGFHYIFKFNHDRMINMMPKIKCPKLYGRDPVGIDMWIQNCQFVASPSVNYLNGGKYKWIKPITSIEDIPEMPEWLYLLYDTENITESGCIIANTQPKQPHITQSKPDSESVDELVSADESESKPDSESKSDSESVDESVDTESLLHSETFPSTIDDLSSFTDSQDTTSTSEEDMDLYDLSDIVKAVIEHPEDGLAIFMFVIFASVMVIIMSFAAIILIIILLIMIYLRKYISKYLNRNI